jgi:hypothetical protein
MLIDTCYASLMKQRDTLREHLSRAGMIGGGKRSRKQTRARRENIRKAQAARWAQRGKKS